MRSLLFGFQSEGQGLTFLLLESVIIAPGISLSAFIAAQYIDLLNKF